MILSLRGYLLLSYIFVHIQSGELASLAVHTHFPTAISKSPSYDDQFGRLNDPHLVAIENVQLYTSAPSC